LLAILKGHDESKLIPVAACLTPEQQALLFGLQGTQ